MPLIAQKKINPGSTLHVWEMTETKEELLDLAHPERQFMENLSDISHDKRRKELLGLKALMRGIGFEHTISYLPNGKPVISDQIQISVSHCDNYAGFLVSNTSCGLDIQNKNRKISIIAPRFCNQKELDDARAYGDTLAYHTALWSIKESIFKVFGEHLPFAENMQVEPFDPYQDDVIKVHCQHERGDFLFHVHRAMINDYFAMMAFLER